MADQVRFDRGARYGAALVGTMFAAWLGIASNFDAFIQASNYAGVLGTDVPLVDLVEFLLILGLFIASFVIIPASAARRVGAVTLTCVVLLLWATFGIERGVGNIEGAEEFWHFILDQGLIIILVSLGGWLLVRGRHPLCFVVLLLAIVPPIVSRALVNASVTSGAYTLATEAMVVLFGVGGAWLAVLIDRRVRRARPVPPSRGQENLRRKTAIEAA